MPGFLKMQRSREPMNQEAKRLETHAKKGGRSKLRPAQTKETTDGWLCRSGGYSDPPPKRRTTIPAEAQ
jgi:hypothetical protein